MKRYRVTQRFVVGREPISSTTKKFVIWDEFLGAYCTLPDGHNNLLPLEWKSHASASAWLGRCYQHWSTWEKHNDQRVPKDWRGTKVPDQPPPNLSPFHSAYEGGPFFR